MGDFTPFPTNGVPIIGKPNDEGWICRVEGGRPVKVFRLVDRLGQGVNPQMLPFIWTSAQVLGEATGTVPRYALGRLGFEVQVAEEPVEAPSCPLCDGHGVNDTPGENYGEICKRCGGSGKAAQEGPKDASGTPTNAEESKT